MPADDHTHDHGSELSEMQLRVRALETILTEKGYVDPAALDQIVENFETKIGPHIGARIVARAVEEPLKQIAVNAGLEGGVVVEKGRNLKGAHGLNAATGEIVDLIAAGIIDPAMVTRSALQNAASIAKNILTTEAIVAEAPEKAGAGMGGGMPDMGGMM